MFRELFNDFLNAFRLGADEEAIEEYYDRANWKTFRLDERVWNYSTFLRPGDNYLRELQANYEMLLEEASESFLYDSAQIREAHNDLHLENCRLEKELAIAEGKIEILQQQLESALEWQTATGRKNEVLTSHGLTPEAIPEQPKANNRFTSIDGKSKKQKMIEAVAMHENGWSYEDIATELNVSISTARAYISTIRGHYTVYNMGNHDEIVFDSQYDNAKFDLALYEKAESSSTGKIINIAMG